MIRRGGRIVNHYVNFTEMAEGIKDDRVGMHVRSDVERFLPDIVGDRPEIANGILLEEFTRSRAITNNIMSKHRRKVMCRRRLNGFTQTVDRTVQVRRQAVPFRNRSRSCDARFLDSLLDIRVFRIHLLDVLELGTGAAKLAAFQVGASQGFLQRQVIRILFDKRFQDITSRLRTVLRRKDNTGARTRRRLFPQGRDGFTSLYKVRTESKNALVKLFGGIEMSLVFVQVALQQKKVGVDRELRKGIFHQGRATIQLATAAVEFRQQLIGSRFITVRKAYDRLQFVRRLDRPTALHEQATIPQPRLVKGGGLFRCDSGQFQCGSRVTRLINLAAFQIGGQARTGVTRLNFFGEQRKTILLQARKRIQFKQGIQLSQQSRQQIRIQHHDTIVDIVGRTVGARTEKFHRTAKFGLHLGRHIGQRLGHIGSIATNHRRPGRKPIRVTPHYNLVGTVNIIKAKAHKSKQCPTTQCQKEVCRPTGRRRRIRHYFSKKSASFSLCSLLFCKRRSVLFLIWRTRSRLSFKSSPMSLSVVSSTVSSP